MKTAPRPLVALAAVLLLVPATAGCMNLATYLAHAIRGHRVPAEYEGLKGKRVAVVCVSGSFDGPRSPSTLLAIEMERILRKEVDEIKLVSQDKVSAWKDTNDWRENDYREIGQGVDAELVIAVELRRFSLYDGPTLYQGKAEVDLTVYDVKTGEPAFERGTPEHRFPSNGYHDPNMREAHFQQIYLKTLAHHLCKPFFDYEFKEDFGGDPASLTK